MTIKIKKDASSSCKNSPRESFKIPSKQWAWLNELSGGLLFESQYRGVEVFKSNPSLSPIWIVCPKFGEFQTMVLCSDSESLASESMKILLEKSSSWQLAGEWKSDEIDFLCSKVQTIERWTGRT